MMSSEKDKQDGVKSSDLQLVNDLNAALQKEKHHGQFWVIALFAIFLVIFVIWAYNSPLEEVAQAAEQAVGHKNADRHEGNQLDH